MKTIFRIFHILISVLTVLAAVLFLFVEGRLVLSGDWLLHESPVRGLLQYFARFALAGTVFAAGLRIIISGGKKTFPLLALCLNVFSAGAALVFVNGIGLLMFGLSLLFTFGSFAVRTAERRGGFSVRTK